MNGRVYDYNVGRFLSVDPLVHEGSQGINPYSYIMNNPLAGTDPTGYKPEIEKIEISEVKTEKVAVTGSRIKRDQVTQVSGTATLSNGSTQDFTTDYSGGNLSSVSTTEIGSQGDIAQSDGGNLDNQNTNGRVERQTDGSVLTPNEEKGITAVDSDGVPLFDETHDDFHNYYLDNSCAKATSGCSVENVRQAVQRYPTPGSDGEPVSDEQVSFALPVGYVRHEVSADGGTVINVTLPPNKNGIRRHLLNPGIVRRWVTHWALSTCRTHPQPMT
jgi:hypothetical protein